jgi:hypothetical protein
MKSETWNKYNNIYVLHDCSAIFIVISSHDIRYVTWFLIYIKLLDLHIHGEMIIFHSTTIIHGQPKPLNSKIGDRDFTHHQ